MGETTQQKGAGNEISRKQNPPWAVGGHEGQRNFNKTDDTIRPPNKQNYRTAQTKDDCNL